jgi:hypothetical protein
MKVGKARYDAKISKHLGAASVDGERSLGCLGVERQIASGEQCALSAS